MELENTIPSEVTQTQKDMHGVYSLISGYKQKTKQNKTKQNPEYPGYSPQNSKRLTSLRAQVRTSQSHLGGRRKQSKEERDGGKVLGGKGDREGKRGT